MAATVSTGVASADAIDDALAKLPAGQISCDQASRYWTNDADFNAKKRQAQTIAAFDRRGPQIQAALGRVEEAANRCGLRGTTGKPANKQQTAPAPAQQNAQPAPQNAQPAQPAQQNAQPAPAPAPQGTPVITLAPANVPTFDMPVAGAVTLRLPDLSVIARELLAKYAPGSSLPF